MIYNYLFYKSYQLAKKSKNWEDAPVFFATIVVGICAILNFASLLFLLEGISGSYFQIEKTISFVNKFMYISGALIAFLIWFFYSYKSRGLKVVNKHTLKENEKGKSLSPLLVVMLAYFISLAIIAITSMYMHRNGIFA